ncbi:hypothetical protein EAI30_12330 [Romboutsia ilealis]|uniref:DUF4825 domain-containing protein n=1 Tax=Romboutsia faecis TaxID=2764597 RepID=A0ABR7JRU7_9FIRM|nr:hypothetical protein [Romboutsia faecis]MBC5997646.1 hypothetical protein [Romboutsia faecis]MRN25405.1 hypothetical protein [Romboutsia ilealis]
MDKNNKKRYIFIVAMTFCLIIGTFKVREYYILKDSFVFSKDNVVRAWTSKEDAFSYNYDCHISEEDITYLSKLLTNAQLEKSSIKEAPDNMGNILLFLDGNIREDEDGSFTVEYKRSINLSKVNNEKVYVILEINKLRDDGSFNMDNIAQKFYTISSKELVKFIENVDSEY